MAESHPDAALTVREAYMKHYDRDELRPNTRHKYEYEIRNWERFTDDLPIGEISNEVVADFRRAALASDLKPATVRSIWGTVRTILRRMGPVTDGNPWGLGIIPRVPAMKAPKEIHTRPSRIDLDDLSRVYVACRHAEYPKVGYPAMDWWRCLLVMAYLTGLRKGDLFSIDVQDIDFKHRRLSFCAQKTGKADDFPLHDVAIEHIRRILPSEGPLFQGRYQTGGRLYVYWHEILEHAGVERFGLHDIRRTACCEIDRIERGMSEVFLQHRPISVTKRFYLNADDELREVINKMRLPIGFKAGPKSAENYLAHKWREQAKQNAPQFEALQYPKSEDWRFFAGAFAYKGRRYKLTGAPLRALKTLVEAGQPVGFEVLAPVVMNGSYEGSAADQRYGRVRTAMANLRKALREIFGFGNDVDPVPCVAVHKSRGGGQWTVCLPPSVGENAA